MDERRSERRAIETPSPIDLARPRRAATAEAMLARVAHSSKGSPLREASTWLTPGGEWVRPAKREEAAAAEMLLRRRWMSAAHALGGLVRLFASLRGFLQALDSFSPATTTSSASDPLFLDC